MTETTHVYQSHLPVSASDALAWHSNPGAFERLSPPWMKVDVVESVGTTNPGDGKTLRLGMGPIGINWKIVHGTGPNGFVDLQERGPFKSWRHEHQFIGGSADDSVLEDRLAYELPLGALGNRVAGRRVRHQLDDLFRFRHRRTQHDLARHAAAKTQGPLRIAVTGATGLVGSQLVPFLRAGGHTVLPIVRRPSGATGEIVWNPATGQIDAAALEGIDAVVHLAGESIADGRWSAARKERIRDSRVQGTTLLARTLAALKQPPRVFVSTSATGYYGDAGSAPLTEESPAGTGFLADVCVAWEHAAAPAAAAGIRVVHPRLGIVIAGGGGMLAKLAPIFRLGAGGAIGRGQQFMSWIALDDLLALLLEAIVNEQLSGPVNAVAPRAVTNQEFTKTLARVLHRPAIIPVPAPMLRLALGQMADELLIASQNARPARLEAAGFRFAFPSLEDALRFELGALKDLADAPMLEAGTVRQFA